MHLEAVSDPRWAAALDLLESGEAAIGLSDLTLSCDPATDRIDHRLQVEFPCLVDPVSGGAPPSSHFAEVARSSLGRARTH